MAIENDDLLVLQKNGGGQLRKASVGALLSQVITPTVPEELSDLNDVDTAGATDGQVLKWNDGDGEWQPADDQVQNLDNYLQKPGSDGSFVIVENSGAITYSETIDGGEYAT